MGALWSGHLKKRFPGITGLICSLVKKKSLKVYDITLYRLSSETQLVETRKTNHPGYLHISFQTGPRGEIKNSWILSVLMAFSVISFIGCHTCIIFPVIDSVRLSCRMALSIVEDFDTKFRVSNTFQ